MLLYNERVMPLKLPRFFSSFFSGWVGPPRILGIDIGTASIKAVQLAREGGAITLGTYGILENYAHLERVNEAIQTSSLKMIDELTVELGRQLLDAMRPTTKQVIFSIPVFSAFVTAIELPKMTGKELEAAIPFEAKRYVPIPIDEVSLDWMDLGVPPSGDQRKSQILLVAVPQDTLGKYQRIAERLGLTLRGVELEPIALTRAILDQDKSVVLTVDIGARTSTISVVDAGYVRMTKSIDTGGGDITQVIANSLNVSPRSAEETKRTKGLLAGPGSEVYAGIVLPLLGFIATEAKKVGEQYTEKTHREVQRIVLSGGTASILGIEDFFQKEIEKPVVRANPFTSVVHDPIFEPILKDLGPSLAIAVGLSLRELLRY